MSSPEKLFVNPETARKRADDEGPGEVNESRNPFFPSKRTASRKDGSRTPCHQAHRANGTG